MGLVGTRSALPCGERMTSTGCLGPTVTAVALHEQMWDVTPNVRVPIISESEAAISTPVAEVGEISHEVTHVHHGVWVSQKPHLRLSDANEFQHGSNNATSVEKISRIHRLGRGVLSKSSVTISAPGDCMRISHENE
jgi:desulfoferrodoxin (superoxide reductase-like protein)